MIASSHLPLHHTILGPAPGQPVLYVHGFPLSGDLWIDAATRIHASLRPGRYRHIIPDLRGMGASPAPSDSASVSDYTEDLLHLLTHLREERPVVVVGLSFGVVIALDLFRRRRGAVRALVLADGRAEPDSPEGARERQRLAREALAHGSGVLVDSVFGRAFHPEAPDGLKRIWRAIMDATPRAGAAAASRALALRPDSRPTLPTIDVPTLVVCGDADEITPPALMREMHESIPGSRLAVIPRAGHMTPVEQPAAFAETLGAFLESLPRP